MTKAWLVGAAALCLSGCAGYPALYTIDTASYRPPQSGGDTRTHLERSIFAAASLQADYARLYKEAGQLRDILQIPVLVAAGTAGLVLVDGGVFAGGGATRRAAEIGVVATTYSAGKGALVAPGMADFYIKGHGALSCAISYAVPFAKVTSSDAYSAFKEALTDQHVALKVLERLHGTVPSDTGTEAERKVLAAARALAVTTLATAREAQKNALLDLGAADGAATAFDIEAAEISAFVASKGQLRTEADYKTVTGSFEPPAAAREKTTALYSAVTRGGTERLTHADLSAAISAAVEQLLTASSVLSGTTPGYANAIANMQGCSKSLTG